MANIMAAGCSAYQCFLKVVKKLDFLAPLGFRIYLAPIMILAGLGKLSSWEDTVSWFGNEDWGLGLPMPALLAFLAVAAEVVGGFLLLFGALTRLVTIPLMISMMVAAVTVHWDNGWHALPEKQLTMPWEWRTDLIDKGVKTKSKAKSVLKEHSNYKWVTSAGSITILKNGIEFAATYFLMLLMLLFTGGGRFVSIDYWSKRWFCREKCDA